MTLYALPLLCVFETASLPAARAAWLRLGTRPASGLECRSTPLETAMVARYPSSRSRHLVPAPPGWHPPVAATAASGRTSVYRDYRPVHAPAQQRGESRCRRTCPQDGVVRAWSQFCSHGVEKPAVKKLPRTPARRRLPAQPPSRNWPQSRVSGYGSSCGRQPAASRRYPPVDIPPTSSPRIRPQASPRLPASCVGGHLLAGSTPVSPAPGEQPSAVRTLHGQRAGGWPHAPNASRTARRQGPLGNANAVDESPSPRAAHAYTASAVLASPGPTSQADPSLAAITPTPQPLPAHVQQLLGASRQEVRVVENFWNRYACRLTRARPQIIPFPFSSPPLSPRILHNCG